MAKKKLEWEDLMYRNVPEQPFFVVLMSMVGFALGAILL